MADSQPVVEHLDVLVIGAGLSGIGTACYVKKLLEAKKLAILESRGAAGGTWDLFRYPGIRSDSDLQTFGYEFKPWREKEAIADAPQILSYLRETAAEHGVDRDIRYHHRVVRASWSSSAARWTVDVERTDTGERVQLSASWIFSAAGYYRYDEGFTPKFEGRDQFRGTIVHPQHWPEHLDYTGKRVVVIGSGATAVTLVPAMADDAEHVVMLQRTPSYVLPIPRRDRIANALQRFLGAERGYAITRRKNIGRMRTIYWLCRRYPNAARRFIKRQIRKQLPTGYPVDKHFTPPYDPFDQRLCMVPDGDLFRCVADGRASIVTDRIATFTPSGIRLESGQEIEADVVVTATGLNLQAFGGIELTVDGVPTHLSDTVTFKGMMLSGIPNFTYALGYAHSSWTLKIGPVSEHFSMLLDHMDTRGHEICRPMLADPLMPRRPLMALSSGYVRRSVNQLPHQGDRRPWTSSVDLRGDVALLRKSGVVDPALHFSKAAVPAKAQVPQEG
ncbi:flavin-containing monooxygenase [Streptomyces sp. NPDC058375]|uniref:flavin-containing monooxygenase n=1 Tax=Streptomyces sp. NPDC058375 TaxID=3346467 RepID=UPI00365C47DB